MLHGKIDLEVKAWIRILWKKLQKTWKKNLVDWSAHNKDICLDGSSDTDSTSGCPVTSNITELGTTYNMVTLPVLEIADVPHPDLPSWVEDFLSTIEPDEEDFYIRQVTAIGAGWGTDPGEHCGVPLM